jgi:excisionase family DNA binding protein
MVRPMSDDVLTRAIGPLPFPSFWRIDELARLLELEPAAVRRMIGAREIPSFWVGGEYRVLTKDIIAWLLLQRSGAKRYGRRRG